MFNKKILTILTASIMFLAIIASYGQAEEVSLYYGDVNLDGTEYTMPGSWNLNQCPLTITYKQDLSGAPNVSFTQNWAQMGIVGLMSGDGVSGAKMVGFLADWDNPNGVVLFPAFPDKPFTLDNDDKFNMQRFPSPGSYDEAMYDVNCLDKSVASPFGSGRNYGIWFDRDGVDAYQPNMWGMVNGGTYNTNGLYEVMIAYDWDSLETKGIACPVFFPNLANDDSPYSEFGIPTGFYSGVWTPTGPDKFPAGISFDTTEARMADMRVKVSGTPSPGTISIKDLTVSGCLNLEAGMATGGGWFIPETNQKGLINLGYKATFGFVAKQKQGISSGQLEFQYHGDGLILKSTSYDWVTVASTQAMFEGTGMINGVDGYKFRVRAVDGDRLGTGIDRFEIRIWTNGDDFDSPTYRAEGDLAGGQIVVHKK